MLGGYGLPTERGGLGSCRVACRDCPTRSNAPAADADTLTPTGQGLDQRGLLALRARLLAGDCSVNEAIDMLQTVCPGPRLLGLAAPLVQSHTQRVTVSSRGRLHAMPSAQWLPGGQGPDQSHILASSCVAD